MPWSLSFAPFTVHVYNALQHYNLKSQGLAVYFFFFLRPFFVIVYTFIFLPSVSLPPSPHHLFLWDRGRYEMHVCILSRSRLVASQWGCGSQLCSSQPPVYQPAIHPTKTGAHSGPKSGCKTWLPHILIPKKMYLKRRQSKKPLPS